ncbi:MAG: 50S ribosomal protein L29, partial [Flavobacteriaceae bacterium]|nr:50S ribosomal protein L29 [Flavobacteriaceae bacterium]
MKTVDLRKLADAELKERMDELAAEHMKLRFQ